MMFRAAFSLFALGLVAAQQSVVFHTQGRGGDTCGKYHRCIDTARCEKVNVRANPFYGEHLCLCSDLTQFGKDGNGLVSCVENEDKYITVQNDPHLRNFLPEFADLASPCRYKLAHLVIKPSEKVLAEVELFGENTLVSGGKYYMSKAILRTNINVDGDVIKQVMSFYGDISRMSDDLYNYTLVARSLESEGIATGETLDIFNLSEDSPFYGYFMDVSKDTVNNLLVAKIHDLGIELDFRPPSVQEKLDNHVIPFVPGAVFRVRSDMWSKVVVDLSERQLANWPENKPLEQQAEEMIPPMRKDLYVQYLMLNSSTPAQENEICHETENIWARAVVPEKTRHLALEKCSPIYTDMTFTRCISEETTMDQYFVQQKQAFQRCLKSFMDADVVECEQMKEFVRQNTKCPMPESIETLDCSIVKDRATSNVVV